MSKGLNNKSDEQKGFAFKLTEFYQHTFPYKRIDRHTRSIKKFF